MSEAQENNAPCDEVGRNNSAPQLLTKRVSFVNGISRVNMLGNFGCSLPELGKPPNVTKPMAVQAGNPTEAEP